MRGLPRDISDFEMKAFFTFDGAERDAINARRGDSHKLGLALHIGFLRMSGRLLGAFRVIPVALWRHLGNELGIAAPEVASLRAMYERGRTLFDHQQVACTVLGFQWMSEHQRRSLVRELRDEVARCADRDQLLVRARQWLYKNKLVIVHERAIRTLIAAALAQLEVETGTAIAASVDPATLNADTSERRLLITGIVGTIIAALCCFTPVLAVLLGVVGLSALLGWLDIVLFPALAFFIGLTIYAVWRRQRNTRNS